MARHRTLAASPVRSAAEVWDKASDLVATTLAKSDSITEVDVRSVFDTLRAAGHALVAGGHLDREPITVVAEPLRLTVGTATGTNAFAALEAENDSPVPGAATATQWTVHLPRPSGLASLINEVAAGVDHATSDDPPSENEKAATASAVLDLRRLDPAQRN